MRFQRLLPLLLVLAAAAPGVTPWARAQVQRDPALSTPPAPARTLSIEGRAVLGQDAGAPPVRRARVTLTGHDGFATQVTDTDTEGAFRFEGLPAGTFRLLIEKPGFLLLEREPGHASVDPLPVTVADGSPVNMTVPMQAAAAMEGRLVAENGEPAAGVIVSAVRLVYGPYGRRPGVIRQATTDDLGRFRVHTMASGDYYLEAAPNPWLGLTLPLPPDRVGFGRSYFPGTDRLEDARVVSLAPSQELADLDFRVTSVRVASISGTVLDSTGKPPAVSGFRLQRVGAPPADARTVPGRGAEFQLPAVFPGDYWLLATARSTPSAAPEYAAVRITVNGDDQKDLRIITSKTSTVSGRVEVEGAAGLLANLVVTAAETDFELPSSGSPAPGTPAVPGAVGADGSFTLPGLFGNRLFRVENLPPNWGLKSVQLNGVDISDTPVALSVSPQPRTLRIVLTSRTASISGSLEAPTGGPTSGRMVVFSEDPRRWGVRSRLIKTVEVGADGRYAVTGLVAGRYFIIGVGALEDWAWFDPEVLNRLLATATPITLADSQRVTLTLVRR
jgi:hypothetical protein